MPSPKQIEKWTAPACPTATPPDDPPTDLPGEYWESLLHDPRAAVGTGVPIQQRRLSEIPRHVLRMSCLRCERVVEIQKTDAVRFFGQHAIWKDVGRKLLEQTCQHRTGRHEEDGCWPAFKSC